MRSLQALLILLSVTFYANSQTQSDLRILAESWEWKRLLQYNEANVSDIESKAFFLSPDGQFDPYSELKTFIEHASEVMACRFPARYAFAQHHNLVGYYDLANCDDFTEFMRTSEPEGVTLIFADGYLKNPASFHGHLFIRIDQSGKGDGLLATSLNFGAIVPDDDDPLTYIVKGIFGGYDARFSAQPFYRHHISYGQQELRDLWEYKLDLTPYKKQLLTGLLFELSQIKYQYFFIDENCAYFVARALEIVAPEFLVKSSDKTVIPSEVIKSVMSAGDQQMVSEVTLIKSQQKKFQNHFHVLTKRQQVALADWIKRDKGLFDGLSKPSQKKVLITLGSYYAFRIQQSPDNENLKQARRDVIKSLLQYEPGNTIKLEEEQRVYPHEGQAAALLRTELLSLDGNLGGKITMRPTYYDRIQPSGGRPNQSAMAMGQIGFYFDNDHLELDHLYGIHVESFDISSTGVEGDGGESWTLTLGAQRNRLRSIDAKVAAFVAGGYGIATKWRGIVPYLFGHGRVHMKETERDNHSLTASMRAGLEWRWFGEKAFCEAEKPFSITTSVTSQDLIGRCHLSLNSTNNSDFRFTVEAQNTLLISLAASIYF
ncbi:DUF4105 domain-containing protein [Alteromonas sp. ASW11-19]|uniref:DUF4105 domain-containing protein n=1 Tax=Alteromonas salexigens TaxID=2982530 RepID=A0ABT2VPW5_9ALTE|nr:DUF4105 domain-containing protein [Alteromonas salexigens]MCU7554918.1 DUF4105 domain-containing protein [Alteromonas salexigens]